MAAEMEAEGHAEAADHGRVVPFEFRGNGFEYFKIWIVNILLTILTLGIYSAWAKVRNNRYFYSNLYLDGESFRYLADPVTILKGRIIAVVGFLVFIIAGEYNPVFGIALSLLLMIILPYLIVRSLAFNNRMSSYRNIQFRFHGDYKEAAMALLVWPLLGVVTLGLLYPLALLRMNQFIVRNSAYGTTRFGFDATAMDYALIMLMFIGGMLLTGVVVAVAALVLPEVLISFFGLGMYAIVIVFVIVKMTNLYYNSTTLGDHTFDADLEFPGLFGVYAINFLLTVLTLGLYLPFARVRLTKYRAAHICFIAEGSIDHFIAAEKEQVDALGEEMGEVFDFDIGTI